MKYLLLFFVLVILACGGTEATSQAVNVERLPTDTPAPAAYKIGDTIDIEGIFLTVHSISEPTPSDTLKPADGNKFVALDITLENRTDESLTISALLSMKLKDDQNRQYDVNILVPQLVGGSMVDGEFAAGEALRGPVGFEVPQDATGYEFVFDPSLFGSGKVFVSLQ